MSNEDFEKAKEQMKNYTDFWGGELHDKHLIKDAKNIFDLETILNNHHDYITDMATDAQASLERFKRSIGVF
jgi:hypothetical protein